MKKNYKKPEIQVVKIEKPQLLSASQFDLINTTTDVQM